MIKTEQLKQETSKILEFQGYVVQDNGFYLPNIIDNKKAVHQLSRAERVNQSNIFLNKFLPKAKEYIIDSSELNITKIKPKLIVIESNSVYADLYRWWNMVWWSLPCEKSYGRQMRFIVWDEYHNAPMGLIGLQSPILSWKSRDNYLGITKKGRDFWVNQSMNAQRLGALPPYNKFLGGKLIALLTASDFIRKSFYKKYKDYKTLILKRKIPSNLLFITTTGAYGKSSVYNRLNFGDDKICRFIGYTSGSGSFHIPNTLYEAFIDYLRLKDDTEVGRSFGNGPSVKMKNISKVMAQLGFKNGANHGIKRAVYIFPFVKNMRSVVSNNKKPVWISRNIDELTEFWQQRWAVKRTKHYPKERLYFSKEQFLTEVKRDLDNCKSLVNQYTYD